MACSQPLFRLARFCRVPLNDVLHFGYTSTVGSKSMPTPATNTNDGLDLHLAQNNLKSTHQLHSCLLWTRRVPGPVSNFAQKEQHMMIQHTRAIHDNTSSGPMPAPRSRPSKRRDTTKANMTHNTLIVMRASRACLVISTFLISVMLEDVRVRQWRWIDATLGKQLKSCMETVKSRDVLRPEVALDRPITVWIYRVGCLSCTRYVKSCCRSCTSHRSEKPEYRPDCRKTALEAGVSHVSSVQCQSWDRARRARLLLGPTSYPCYLVGMPFRGRERF